MGEVPCLDYIKDRGRLENSKGRNNTADSPALYEGSQHECHLIAEYECSFTGGDSRRLEHPRDYKTNEEWPTHSKPNGKATQGVFVN